MKGIRRLAEHLNISIGTVSRALNGKHDVSEATRQRVLEAAQLLGYVPNQSGQALRKGSTSTIGFMIQTGPKTTRDGDTFFMSVFDGVQTVLTRHQLDLVALLCGADVDPYDYLRRVAGRGFVDGLIISATQRKDPRIDFLAGQKIPFIALGRSLNDAGHAWYDLDYEGMAAAAVARFARKGHRRIALAASNDNLNLEYILIDAYRAALETHGIAFDSELVLRATPDQIGGYSLAGRLLEMQNRPTAILLTHEQMTVGLYRGVLDAGLTPGRDIAVIGRDSPHARFLSPTLTSFQTSLRDLGIALAESLLATMPAFQDIYPQGIVRTIWRLSLTAGESDAFELDPVEAKRKKASPRKTASR